MGLLLRLAASVAFLWGILHAAEYTSEWPVDKEIRGWNEWINSLIIPPWFAEKYGLTHELTMYLRNLVFGTLQYQLGSGLWSLYIYVIRRKHFFPDSKKMPTREMLWDHLLHGQSALFSYALLPMFSSFLSERKLNLTYGRVSDVGWPMYCLYTFVYFWLVEFAVYFVHRNLHTIKFLYNHVHLMHHKYNKPEEMSPYASIAFHPLDGIMQASPYVIMLFVVPMHFLTSLVMLFFTGIWAMNIHDNVNTDSNIIMGAKFHTAHHVYYVCNHGQFFTFCDRIFGTFRMPPASYSRSKSS